MKRLKKRSKMQFSMENKAVVGINNAFRTILDNPFILAAMVVIDAFYLIAYGAMSSAFYEKIYVHWNSFLMLISSKSGELTTEFANNGSLFSTIMSTPEIKSQFLMLAVLYLMMLVFTYLIFNFVQAVSFWLVRYWRREKIPFPTFTKIFLRVNIPVFLVVAVIHMISFFNELAKIRTIGADAGANVLDYLIFVIYLILIVYAVTNYSIIGDQRKYLKVLKSNGDTILFCMFITAIIIGALYLALQLVINYVPSYLLIAQIIMVLPVFVFIKLYIREVMADMR